MSRFMSFLVGSYSLGGWLAAPSNSCFLLNVLPAVSRQLFGGIT